jgi:hypothetical protein
MTLQLDSESLLVIAWLYVAARVVHAIIHIGANRVRPRMLTYMFSWLMLLALWIKVTLMTSSIK